MFKNIGGVAFGFMLPVLAGFIAMAIGDRPALAVGFVGGMMAASGTSGFLGALVAGFAAGYIILGLRKVCEKLPEALEKIAPVLIYPVVGILAMGLLMLFIVEPIMGTVNTVLNNGLASMGGSSKLILGMILGGMMAIELKSGREATAAALNKLQLCTIAVSLGDAETLVEHPATMTHSTYTAEELKMAGISEGLVRISIGLEDPEDIIADFKSVLDPLV